MGKHKYIKGLGTPKKLRSDIIEYFFKAIKQNILDKIIILKN